MLRTTKSKISSTIGYNKPPATASKRPSERHPQIKTSRIEHQTSSIHLDLIQNFCRDLQAVSRQTRKSSYPDLVRQPRTNTITIYVSNKPRSIYLTLGSTMSGSSGSSSGNKDLNSKDNLQDIPSSGPDQDLDPRQTAATLAWAFQELAKGESTATAMENKLSILEARIEELLGAVGEGGGAGEGTVHGTEEEGKK